MPRFRLLPVLIPFVLFALWYCLYLPYTSEQRPIDFEYGRLKPLHSTSRFAIVTLLGTDTFHLKQDYYFVASRLLTYQILHAPETRIRDEYKDRIDWIVGVTPSVDTHKREQLTRDGAKVVEIENVPLRWWVRTGISRWKDQFAKLRLLQWTQYDRVLFLDADILLLHPIDAIFETEPRSRSPYRTDFSVRRRDEAPLPAEYVFLAGQDHEFTGRREHAVPPLHNQTTGVFSGGFWLAAPSLELYEHLTSIMNHYRRFDPTTMEQSLLNYAFRHCDASVEARQASMECPEDAKAGPMPWHEAHWSWISTWPSVKDAKTGVVGLHEKFWKTGPPELRELWEKWRKRMEEDMGKTSPN